MSTENRATEVAQTLETGQAAVEQAAQLAVRKPDRRYVVGVALAASMLTAGVSVAVSTAAASEVARSVPPTVTSPAPEALPMHRAGYMVSVRDQDDPPPQCQQGEALAAELVAADGRRITGWFCLTSTTEPTTPPK